MTKKALTLLALVALMVVAASAVATAATPLGQARIASHVESHLKPVGGSGVHGTPFPTTLGGYADTRPREGTDAGQEVHLVLL